MGAETVLILLSDVGPLCIVELYTTALAAADRACAAFEWCMASGTTFIFFSAHIY
jgi:hypothetical protein